MKKRLRIFALVFGAFFALIAAALIFIDSRAGHSLIRSIALDVLNESVLTGRAEIDAIEGSLYGDLRVRGVRVFDSGGNEALNVGGLRVAYDLGALFDGVVQIDAIEIDQPVVSAIIDREGKLNLAGLVKTSTPAAEEEPKEASSIQLLLASFVIREGRVRVKQPDRALDLAVELRAAAGWSGDRLSADLALNAGSMRLVVDQVRWAAADQTAQGNVQLILPASLWAELGLDPALLADFSITLKLSPGDAARPWKVSGDGKLSGGTITLQADAGIQGGAARIELAGIDPSRLHAQAPQGSLGLIVDADLPRWDQGRAKLSLHGGVALDGQRWKIEALRTIADLSPKTIEVTGDLALSGSNAAAKGEVEATWSAALDANKLTQSNVSLRASSLRGLVPLPLDGAIALDATASGPLDALKASAKVRGSTLSFDAVALRELQLDVRVAGIPSAISAHAEVSLQKLKIASAPDFVERIGLTATATQTGRELAVALHTLSLDTPKASWRAAPARLRLGDVIVVEGFDLSSAAGRITAGGSIDPARFPKQPSDLQVAIQQLDLAAFAPLIGELSGKIDLDARLAAIDGVATASVSLAATELHRGKAGPLSLRTEVALQGPKFSGNLAIDGPGSITAIASGVAPHNPLDANAWSKNGSIEAIEGAIQKLSLAELSAFTGTTAQIAGLIDGKFKVTSRGETIDLTLEAREVSAPALALPADLDLELKAQRDRIEGNVVALFKRSPVMRVNLSSSAGTDDYRRLGLRALEQQGARLRINAENVPVALIAELARLDPKDPLFADPRGSISLQLSAGATAIAEELALSARVEGRDVAFAKGAPELDLTATATLSRGRALALVDAAFVRHGGLHLEAEADLGSLDAELIKAKGLDVISGVRGEVHDLRLELVKKLGIAAGVPDGVFYAKIGLGAGLRSGAIDLALQDLIADERIAPIDLRARATLSEKRQTLTATVAIADRTLIALEGEIDATMAELSQGKIDDAPLAARATTSNFQLRRAFDDAQLAKLVGGKLGLDVEVGGSVAKPAVKASVAIEDALIGGAPFGALAASLEYAKDRAQVGFEARGNGSLTCNAELKELSKKPTIDAEIKAEAFDLHFLGPLAKAAAGAALGLDGKLAGTIRAQGGVNDPQLSGAMKIESLRAVFPGAPALAKSTVELRLDPSKIGLNIGGELGGGELAATLSAIRSREQNFQLEGLITTRGVKVAAGQQVAAIDSEVRLKGQKKAADLEADITIGPMLVSLPAQKTRKLRVIEDFEDLELVASFDELLAGRSDEKPAKPDKPGGRLKVAIKTPEPIVIRGGDADLRVDVDLALTGEGSRKRMTGDVEVERGRLAILGKAYQFRRGQVLFDGPFPPDPRLDIELTHDFEALTLMVLVTGTGRKPKIRFASDPGGYDQSELLSFFIGGGPGEGGAGKAAGGLLASQIPGAARDSLPIDTVDLDLGEGGKGASVTTGKWVTDDVFVAYTYRFDPKDGKENKNEGVVRWHFARGWTLETRFGNASIGSIETTWVKRY